MEAEKLITIIPYKGPIVARMTLEDALELYEVRSLLECRAAELFAELATEREIQAMSEALEAFERAAQENDALARLTSTDAFYEVLLRGCGNKVITETLENLHARINFLRYRSMSSADRSSHSNEEMRAILKGVMNHSPAEAGAAARTHVRNAREAVIRAWGTIPDPKHKVSRTSS